MYEGSTWVPSIIAPTVALPKLEPIVFANSTTVIGFSSCLLLPSGNIISIIISSAPSFFIFFVIVHYNTIEKFFQLKIYPKIYLLNKKLNIIPKTVPQNTSRGVCPKSSLNFSFIISIPSRCSIASINVFNAFACFPA